MEERLPEHQDELENILAFYPVQVESTWLLFNRGGRKQWLVKTNQGHMILKKEPRKFEKTLFISGAQQHLQEKGLPISKLIQTSDGDLCLDGGDHSYVLYEAHSGQSMNYYNRDHLLHAMAFKAEFHDKSKGYAMPDGGKKRRRLGKWEKLYRWKLQELEGFKMLAGNQVADPFSQLFTQNVDAMLDRGRQAMGEINRPEFSKRVQAHLDQNAFCEQDFTLSRLIMKEGRPFMRELRSVNIDLPTRDLRIFLDKVMKKFSVWDSSLCCDMLKAYDEVHPLEKEDYRALWTDLRFPHVFCSIAQNYYLREKKSWSDDKYLAALKNVMAVESSKQAFLDQFDDVYSEIKSVSPR
ncbi:MAG TPA: CotS family spore coat protein [Bacillales bacterium]|nr:CotS family spore coat protein [Bacillales bacterium]